MTVVSYRIPKSRSGHKKHLSVDWRSDLLFQSPNASLEILHLILQSVHVSLQPVGLHGSRLLVAIRNASLVDVRLTRITAGTSGPIWVLPRRVIVRPRHTSASPSHLSVCRFSNCQQTNYYRGNPDNPHRNTSFYQYSGRVCRPVSHSSGPGSAIGNIDYGFALVNAERRGLCEQASHHSAVGCIMSGFWWTMPNLPSAVSIATISALGYRQQWLVSSRFSSSVEIGTEMPTFVAAARTSLSPRRILPPHRNWGRRRGKSA
jgi:hypothetical protein